MQGLYTGITARVRVKEGALFNDFPMNKSLIGFRTGSVADWSWVRDNFEHVLGQGHTSEQALVDFLVVNEVGWCQSFEPIHS